MKRWTTDTRGKESRLAFDTYEIVVHRHIDEDPGQWFYSCHGLGQTRRKIGRIADSIESAQTAAMADLQHRLNRALIAITEAMTE